MDPICKSLRPGIQPSEFQGSEGYLGGSLFSKGCCAFPANSFSVFHGGWNAGQFATPRGGLPQALHTEKNIKREKSKVRDLRVFGLSSRNGTRLAFFGRCGPKGKEIKETRVNWPGFCKPCCGPDDVQVRHRQNGNLRISICFTWPDQYDRHLTDSRNLLQLVVPLET